MADLFDFKTRRTDFAVMGNPVQHSRSPDIHRQFARQCGMTLEYGKIQVDPGGFSQAVSHFHANGGAGLNITVPYKEEAWKLCCKTGNRLSARADTAQAVNTLRFEPDDTVFGDNTDGLGLVRDIQDNLGLCLSGTSILILGAGGAVKGILEPLLDCRPEQLCLSNRTSGRATDLAGRYGGQVIALGLEETGQRTYDLIVNGTSSGLAGARPAIPDSCIHSGTLAYDLMYGPQPTAFMKWALDCGARAACDGLGMLVEQAAESFFIWHNTYPDTEPVIRQIRKALHDNDP